MGRRDPRGVAHLGVLLRVEPHYVLLVGLAVVGISCGIEAHRSRSYDVWRSRVRTLQVNASASPLDPSVGVSDRGWRATLARDYREPAMRITREEAFVALCYLAAGFVAFRPLSWRACGELVGEDLRSG